MARRAIVCFDEYRDRPRYGKHGAVGEAKRRGGNTYINAVPYMKRISAGTEHGARNKNGLSNGKVAEKNGP